MTLPKNVKKKGRKQEYMFTYIKDRTVCGANVAVRKEYNISRHNETKHHDKYNDLDMTQRRQK